MPTPYPNQAGPPWDEDGNIQPVWDYWLRQVGEDTNSDQPGTPPAAAVASMLGMSPFKTASGETLVAAMGLLMSMMGAKAASNPIGEAADALMARPDSSSTRDHAELLAAMRPQKLYRPQIRVCTQATFPVLASLRPQTFIYVSDYVHMIYWDGTTPVFAGDQSGLLHLAESDPGTGYHLYDGATVNRLNADGTVTSVTLPDLTTAGALAAFLEGGGTNSGPTGAVAPTLTGATGSTAVTVTGSTASGTAAIAGNTGNDDGSPQTVQSGTGATVPAEPHAHPVGTIADSGHSHGVGSLAGEAHTHAVGTLAVTATGEPRKLIRRPYYRQ